jgi:hypothetical protein
MKAVKKYNGEIIQAYQAEDLEKLKLVFAAAKLLWIRQWKDQGALDQGSCCGGKGISVPFIGKGKRNYESINVVSCDFVQGNVSAYESVGGALAFLKEMGVVGASYNDGWMD